MSQTRYQIFVSSTFQDLQDEREAILKAVLKLNQFPAGMEIFPAANETPWDVIEQIIKESDYYVLIIGGKYGSMDKSGISYTEKEYDFAVSQGIPVLAFIHADPEIIPAGKVEMDVGVRKKLDAFKEKVGIHHCKFWKTIDELKENVLIALTWSFATKPRVGWARADGIDNTDLLKRLAELQQKHDNLIEENIVLKESVITVNSEQFAFGSDKFKIEFTYRGNSKIWQCEISWNNLFFIIGELAVVGCQEWEIKSRLSYSILNYFEDMEDFSTLSDSINSNPVDRHQYDITKECFKTIRNQFLALRLIDVSASTFTKGTKLSNHTFTSTEVIRMWELTDKGRRLFLNKIAIRNTE